MGSRVSGSSNEPLPLGPALLLQHCHDEAQKAEFVGLVFRRPDENLP